MTKAIPAGTTLSAAIAGHSLSPQPGAYVDISGDVLLPGAGEPGAIEINGRPAAASQELPDGATVAAGRGRDRVETLSRRTEMLPYDVVTEGRGPVVQKVRQGSPGERHVYLGKASGKLAASITVREPVDALVRRSQGTPERKVAALTFDDGPSKYTGAILDVLAAKGIRATFFMLGVNAVNNPALVARVRAAGHEIGNHTYQHPILTRLSSEAIRAELTRANTAMGRAKLMRPPAGAYNSRVLKEVTAMGMRLVMWDVDTRDWQTRNAASILAKVKAGIKPEAIILMHDGGGDRSQTVAALPAVIDWLLQQGYSLTTVSELGGS